MLLKRMPQNNVTENIEWIPARWPAPENIHAGSTTRIGKHGLNATGRDNGNYQLLSRSLQLPSEPVWLTQTHSNRVVDLDTDHPTLDADGASCTMKNTVCCVLTADCIPLLLYDARDGRIAAVHIGWRGLCAGIIENVIKLFSQTTGIIGWIGPAISAARYEVGTDVYTSCIEYFPEAKTALSPNGENHWLADLKKMVKMKLNAFNITRVFDSGLCTCLAQNRLYSYRRDGATGRIATMIWMA